MSVKIKICGLNNSAVVDKVITKEIDFAGFIFYPKSPRNISLKTAKLFAEKNFKNTKKVAVTVNPTIGLLKDIIQALQPDYIQLHGNETPEYTKEIKTKFGLPIIKALPILTLEDLKQEQEYIDVASYILLDTKVSKESTSYGGTGRIFNWDLINQYKEQYLKLNSFIINNEYLLSGGLNIENIQEAILRTNASLLDISSGVESSKGVKSLSKTEDLINKIRSL